MRISQCGVARIRGTVRVICRKGAARKISQILPVIAKEEADMLANVFINAVQGLGDVQVGSDVEEMLINVFLSLPLFSWSSNT